MPSAIVPRADGDGIKIKMIEKDHNKRPELQFFHSLIDHRERREDF